MAWILAQHPDYAFAFYDLALCTNLFYRRSDLHNTILLAQHDSTLGAAACRAYRKSFI